MRRFRDSLGYADSSFEGRATAARTSMSSLVGIGASEAPAGMIVLFESAHDRVPFQTPDSIVKSFQSDWEFNPPFFVREDAGCQVRRGCEAESPFGRRAPEPFQHDPATGAEERALIVCFAQQGEQPCESEYRHCWRELG